MNADARLTPRETEVAELLAWGAAKKEVADRLFISTRTVENTARNIYEKVGIQKATELCVWWFCTHCGVSFELNPLKRGIIAAFLLMIILPYEFLGNKDILRTFRIKPVTRVAKAGRRGRRNDSDLDLTNYFLEA